MLSTILKRGENKKYTAAIFLDLSTAFDSLDHSILLKKLEKYGVRGVGLDWLKSYLENQTMSIKCSAGDPCSVEISDPQNIEYGVPQGSCLGPLLFLVYCNDLPINLESCNSILFADDMTLYKSHKNLRYLKWSLQHELHFLVDWFRANKLTLNLSNSVVYAI